MRRVLYYLFWFLLLGALVIWWLKPLAWWHSLGANNYDLREDQRSSITYLLDANESLSFKIPSFTHKLKFIFTANLPADIPLEQSVTDLRYSVEYELLDRSNRVIARKIYHLRSAYLLFLDQNDSFVEKSFYFTTTLRPSLGEHMVVNLSNYPQASTIRFRLHHKESRIVDVVMRSYHLETIEQQKQNIKWERIPLKRRQYLARGNIYDTTFMNREEQHQLISAYWRPNGALGVEGKDYQIRRLVVSDWENIEPYSQFRPAIYADDRLHATRYLMEGNYTMEIEAVQKGETNATLNLYTPLKLLRSQNLSLTPQKKIRIALNREQAGVVEVQSDQSVAIKIYEANTSKLLSLPPLFSTEYYDINQTQKINYHFHTPHSRLMRLECYAANETNATLGVSLKDEKGRVVAKGEHNLSFILAHYHYRDDFIPLSEPKAFYFMLSDRVKSVEVESNSSLIVRLSQRSPRIAYPLYSFNTYEEPDYPRLPTWFPLKAADANQSVALFKQPKPPLPNPFILSGFYDYEQLYPTQIWRGYAQLVKRRFGDEALRSQSWSSLYSKVLLDGSPIVFHDKAGVTTLTPTLFYQGAKPQKVTLYQEGKALISKYLWHATGSWVLPKMQTNYPYHLELNATQTKLELVLDQTNYPYHLESNATQMPTLYLSHTADGKEHYLKRTFMLFDRALSFEVSKGEHNTTLSIQLATSSGDEVNATEFQALFEPISSPMHTLFSTWSFQSYQLFAKSNDERSINLTNPQEVLNLSNTLYLPLGENIPQGNYRITLYPPKEYKRFYLFVSRIALGAKAQAKLSKEQP